MRQAERADGVPPKDLFDDRVDVREVGAVAKVGHAVATDYTVDLLVRLGLDLGVERHLEHEVAQGPG